MMPARARCKIDGHDLRDVTLDSLRSQIGIVLQETNLFSGTIRDNIAFGRPDATQEQVEAAARAASAHDFIMSFPQGYDTPVGERGATLSGGQKQRIAIARALLLDPRLLILDDSTCSVDLQTEYRIQQALDRLMHGRTSFVIAQRISTVLNADQILVLDQRPDRGARQPRRADGYKPDLRRNLYLAAGRRCRPRGDGGKRRRRGRGHSHMMGGLGGRASPARAGHVQAATKIGATLARFWRYVSAYWFGLMIALVAIIGSTWTQVTAPDLIGQIGRLLLFPQSGCLLVHHRVADVKHRRAHSRAGRAGRAAGVVVYRRCGADGPGVLRDELDRPARAAAHP